LGSLRPAGLSNAELAIRVFGTTWLTPPSSPHLPHCLKCLSYCLLVYTARRKRVLGTDFRWSNLIFLHLERVSLSSAQGKRSYSRLLRMDLCHAAHIKPRHQITRCDILNHWVLHYTSLFSSDTVVQHKRPLGKFILHPPTAKCR
jgi:hypothetical protein